MLHFIMPSSSTNLLDEILKTTIEIDYPYWLGGQLNWVAQAYLMLRRYKQNITISTEQSPGKINFAHVMTWRDLPRANGVFRVSIRADYRKLFDIDFEILQNPMAVKKKSQAYIPYWPVPRIQPRSTNRTTVENIAYAGRIGPLNLERSVKDVLLNNIQTNKRINFKIIEHDKWHDMKDIDILLAIRTFDKQKHISKPPSKLINAWHSEIPLIAGYDSAFSAIGIPGSDYIRVSTVESLLENISRLQNDQYFYRSFVEAGRVKRGEYTHEKIANIWIRIINDQIVPSWECWKNSSAPLHKFYSYNRKNMDSLIEFSKTQVKYFLNGQ
jgi:hypothetical protein